MPNRAPFLTYLTVFKSRLGISNLVLSLTGFQHLAQPTLSRNIRKLLDAREDISVDEEHSWLFEYLSEKKTVTGGKKRGSRYYGYSLKAKEGSWEIREGLEVRASLPVFLTDLWMADPRVPSTIGVPTPENVDEALELVYQLNVLSRRTNAWTSSGQLLAGLRASWAPGGDEDGNPFILRAEGIGLLRQALREDGLILRPLLRRIEETEESVFSRDWVSRGFAEIVKSAVSDVKELGFQPPVVRKAREHLALIEKTADKFKSSETSAQSGSSSRGPGVLEHRVAPRLEWLTDVGILTKDGLPKNSFQYRKTSATSRLLQVLEGEPAISAEDAALDQWRTNEVWGRSRESMKEPSMNHAVARAYTMVQRRIGPSSLGDVAFLSALFAPEQLTFSDTTSHLIDLAQAVEGITLSGGRYRRGPENISMSDAALQRLE